MSPQYFNHIHLDVVGGIAGDMFAAAILDLVPSLQDEVDNMLSISGLTEMVDVQRHDADGVDRVLPKVKGERGGAAVRVGGVDDVHIVVLAVHVEAAVVGPVIVTAAALAARVPI